MNQNTKNLSFQNITETLLNVGLALEVHKSIRSKFLVEKLGQLDLTVPYKKFMEIETAIANAVLERENFTGGLCPPWLVHDMFVWFALDDRDFLESTPSGMNTRKETAITVYQTASDSSSTITN